MHSSSRVVLGPVLPTIIFNQFIANGATTNNHDDYKARMCSARHWCTSLFFKNYRQSQVLARHKQWPTSQATSNHQVPYDALQRGVNHSPHGLAGCCFACCPCLRCCYCCCCPRYAMRVGPWHHIHLQKHVGHMVWKYRQATVKTGPTHAHAKYYWQ